MFDSLFYLSYVGKEGIDLCSNDDYGHYESFGKAQEACKKDSNCDAIYDLGCNGNYFYLCPQGYTEKISKSSCLNIKPAGTVIIKIIKMNILQHYYC